MMVELAAGLATLSLFLMWRLFVANRKLYMAESMIKAVIHGEVSFVQTEDGVEIKMKGSTSE